MGVFSDIARAFTSPLGSLAGQGLGALGGGGKGFFGGALMKALAQAPAAPVAPAVDLRPPTIDQARLRREQSDAFLRKRGRRASILTGPDGVAPSATPLGVRTLIGT